MVSPGARVIGRLRTTPTDSTETVEMPSRSCVSDLSILYPTRSTIFSVMIEGSALESSVIAGIFKRPILHFTVATLVFGFFFLTKSISIGSSKYSSSSTLDSPGSLELEESLFCTSTLAGEGGACFTEPVLFEPDSCGVVLLKTPGMRKGKSNLSSLYIILRTVSSKIVCLFFLGLLDLEFLVEWDFLELDFVPEDFSPED